MLRIYHHCPKVMGLTGKDLLKVMQNKSTPVLDLLVRESIQNSLDAQDRTNNSQYVNVDFFINSFSSKDFCEHLEDMPLITKNETEDGKYRFLAFKDTYTKGLTGPLSEEDVVNNEYGNLQKLIYQIFKNQTEAGAGGSWGVGKTTYYGIGVGIVIYYSRIQKEDDQYESRLVVCLVEDQLKPDKILQQKNANPAGVAWWGDVTETGYPIPITDEDKIKAIIYDVFGIEMYSGTMTGTTVIIPYINEQQLLDSNKTQYIVDVEGDSVTEDMAELAIDLPWCKNLADYIKVAVQRWYSPRLENITYYKHWSSKYLKCTINGEEISSDSFKPIFKLIQNLYNACLDESFNTERLQISTSIVKVNKQMDDTNSGMLAYKYVSKEELGLKTWDQLTPAVWFNCKSRNWSSNCPIVAYLRKPGMIVSYDDDSWIKDLPSCDENSFLIALFVVNSKNTLKCENKIDAVDYSLEAYVRECEKGDHMKWDDIQFYNIKKPSIVEKIQNGVRKKLLDFFSNLTDKNDEHKVDYNPASTLLGGLFMPPEGFGNLPTPPQNSSSSSGGKGNTKKYKYTYKLIIEGRDLFLLLNLKTMKNVESDSFSLILLTESSGSPISSSSWEEETGLNIPLAISNVDIISKSFNATPQIDFLETKISHSNYGIHVQYPKGEIDLSLKLSLLVGRKDVKPILRVE